MTLSGLITEHAGLDPHGEAIVDLGARWTYEAAAQRVGQISTALALHGVSAGDRVGVHCNKSAAGFFAMHAAVSLGAVAVPLDPSSPVERLDRICEHTEIDVVVSHRPRRSTADQLVDKRNVRLLHADDPELDSLQPRSPLTASEIDAGDPAYIITTSGTTGEPKGIVHSHRSGRAYADMAVRTYSMTGNDRVSDIAPHHFDISTHSLWAVPVVGATNVVINEAYQRLPASHSQLLQDERVTFWYSVPFLLQQLMTRGDLDNRDLSALRWVHFGGEVISPETVATMMRHCTNARFANIFGPAEVNQCSLAVFDEPPPNDRSVSIGKALDHTQIRIIDPVATAPNEANTVAPGERGEMWITTPQLMSGYWNRPDVNAAVLVAADGDTWYRSGDLASMDSSGELTFYGRVDHQVKVRGYRIELEGVELELEKLSMAEHVVVAVDRAHSGEDELVAGVLHPKSDFDEAAFLRSAASVLPSYAVPTRTVRLENAVFTGSGKLDRRNLRNSVVGSGEADSGPSMTGLQERET